MEYLFAENLLLRGCTLKNTSWVLGLVVYTGMDTKQMCNEQKCTQKVSKIERRTQKLVLLVLIV